MPGFTRRRLSIALGLAAAALPASAPLMARDAAPRPNIVLLLVDDQRHDTLGCAGNPVVKTPVIDRLAADGVRFSHAFVTTPICAASRASILTGLHERTHRFTFGTPPLRAEHMVTSYPAVLREAGYRTGFIGKYGVVTQGPLERTMFDSYAPIGLPFFKKQPDGTERHETEIAGDLAIEFLEHNPPEQPFCLSISFNAAHADDANKEEHFPSPHAVDGMYDDVTIPPPRLSDPEIFDNLPSFLQRSMNRQRYFWRWDTPEKYQRNMRAYYRMISGVDRVIGRVRGALERLQLADRTVIIYTADNGYYMGDRGLAGKWSHYDQSLRVPLILYDPRSSADDRGRVRPEIALNVDIAPTLLALAGAPIPDRYQGRSLTPLLSKRALAPEWREEFFCEHLMEHDDIPTWEGVRGERYVYARYFEQQPVFEFLHDLTTDPDQLVNLASRPEHADILARLRARCDQLKAAYESAGGGVSVPFSWQRLPFRAAGRPFRGNAGTLDTHSALRAPCVAGGGPCPRSCFP